MIELKAADLQAPPSITGLQHKALGIGLVGLAASIAGYLSDPKATTESYLLAFIYWIAFPLGSLGLMMVHHLSGGGWGMPVRRIFEAASRTLPYMAVLGLPVLLGMGHLYEWTDTAKVAADPILRQKEPYLNVPFFLVRYALYFVVWTTLAYLLSGWSRAQDTGYEPGSERKFRLLSGPGILLHGVASTFFVVDLMMSLDPHWFSTIYGLLFLIQQALAAIGFVLLLMATLSKTAPLSRYVKAENIHDYGKFLLTFVMVWAYFSFSQFLIIWSANLPEEIPWYLERMRHGWEWFSVMLLVGQFFLPFFLLLSRDLKRTAGRVAIVAILVLVMRYVDFYWNVMPALNHETPMPHWTNLTTVVGLGGVWVALFAWQYKASPVLPIGDPYLPEALSSHGAH
jgi:hypothetical protein